MTRPKYHEPTAGHPESRSITRISVWDAIGDLVRLDSCPDLIHSDRYHGEIGEPSVYARRLRAHNIGQNCDDTWKTLNGRGLGGCCRTTHTEATVMRFASTHPGTVEIVSRCFRLSCDGLAPTLRAGTGPDHGSHTAARPIHPTMPRYITTREAARLHSFPDWFEFHHTKWHGFRQVGNSVPPILALVVAKSMITAIRA